MNETIDLYNNFGAQILSRANFRRLHNLITANTKELDFTGIDFITRSVADELYEFKSSHPEVLLTGMNGIVSQMYEIVRIGRSTPRKYKDIDKKISYCKTMDDVRRVLKL